MEALSGFIGAVLGALIGGLSVYFSDKRKHEYEKEKAKRDLLLEKYELIFHELRQFRNYGHNAAMQLMAEVGFGGKFEPTKIGVDLSNNNLSMAVKFYAPELADELDVIEEKHKEVSAALARYVINEKEDEKERATGDIIQAARALSELADEFNSKLAKRAQVLIDA